MNLEGVVLKKLQVHLDSPDIHQPGIQAGYLMEILRADEGLLKKFGQSTMTVAYPGTIKAFHRHKLQDDLWFMATGRAVIILFDPRPHSRTYGQIQVIFAGKEEYKLIVIPAGVVHGYKVLGTEPVILFYHTTEAYDPKKPDEERLPWNDPQINFNWSQYE